MAAVLRWRIFGSNLSSSFCKHLDTTTTKCAVKPQSLRCVIRCYKGSARDTKRREWNKKMEKLKREPPRKFDFKSFISENYEKELTAFAHRLDINPENKSLRTALTHETFHQNDENLSLENHNAKLSILGFMITSQLISEFLFSTFQKYPTMILRKLKDYLMSQEVLVKVSNLLSIPELTRTPFDLNSSENSSFNGDIIADSLLALIASIYVDEGPSKAVAFIQDFLLVELHGKELGDIISLKNTDKLLEALLLQQHKEKPVARIISSSAKYTKNPSYVVGVFSSDNLLGKGVSYTSQKAKEEAYSIALEKFLNRDFSQNFSVSM